MNRNQVRKRIEALKEQSWSFEQEDELYHLKHSLSAEMGIPNYLRV